MPNKILTGIYENLKKDGFTDIGKDVSEFSDIMKNANNQKKVFDYIKTKNVRNMPKSLAEFSERIGVYPGTRKQDNIFSEEYLEQVAEPSIETTSDKTKNLMYDNPFSKYTNGIKGLIKPEQPSLGSYEEIKETGDMLHSYEAFRQGVDNETNRIQDEIKKGLELPEVRVAAESKNPYAVAAAFSQNYGKAYYRYRKQDIDAYKNYSTANNLITEAKKTANASKNKSGFWKGVGDNLLTEDAVTLGLSTFRNTQQLKSLLDKVEKEGIQSLTPSENTLLEAASVKSLSDMIYESGLSTLYNVGSATGTSIPYMLQFVITHAPASAIAKPVMKKLTGYVTKRFGEAAIKKAAARAISTLPKVGTKTALKTANALAKTGAAALEVGATGALMPIIQPSMYNDILERRMGQVDADINPQTGKVQYKGQTGEKSWGKSIGEGFTAGAIENLAEMSGGAIMKTLGVPVKALSKVSPKSREFINIISEKPLLRSFNRVREDIAKTTGVHSIPGEALEEFVGQTANALTVGDQKLEDIYTWENAWMTLASVAPLSIGMGSASGVMAQAAKKKVVRDYNRASQKLSEAYSPDLVEYIKSRVGGSPEQQAMIIRQYYDRAREAKNEEEKRNIANEYRLVMDYAAAVNNYDAYIGGIEARVANEVSALSEQIRNDINPDMNATVYIDYDGQMARVTSGNIVFDENGDINDSKSDDTITIELQDGTKQMVSPDKFKVTGYRSFDDQINEATQNIENTILSQEDTDVYGPDPVLDEALYINTDNGPVSVKVTRADYGGFEGIQIDESGKEITEIINGIETPVSIPFSKDQIIRPDNPTIETENNTVAEDARPLQAGDVINVTGFQNPVTFVSESNGDAIVGLLDNMGNPIINTEGKQVQVPVKSEQIIHSQTQSQEIKEETSDSASPVEEEVIPMRKNKKGEQVKDYVSMPDNMFVEHVINDYGNEAAKEGLKDRKRNIDSLINRLKKRRDKSTNTNEKIDIDDEINDLKSRLQILEELSQNLPNEPNSFKERLNSLSEPVSLEDYILQGIASGEYKFKWGGKNGLSDELGLKSDRERRSRIGILKNDGYTPETLAERIFQEIESGQLPFSVEELEIRNSIIDILNRVHSRKRALEESESLQKEFEDQQIRVQEQNSDVVEELTPEELQEIDEAIAELKPIDDIRFRTNMSLESENLQSPDNITLNNEDNSLSSQNDQKEKNGTISESIPQRKYRTQASQDRRMEEAASGLRNRIEASTRDAQKNSGTLSKRQQQEIEQRSAESYAKETGQWIPISDTFTWQPMPSGNENDVYLNTNDGHVYKVNNLINSKGIIPLFDRLILHNQTFPESKYEFVGFTGFDNGNIFPVFRQQYVNNATFATPQEIGEYMQSLGFKQTGDAKYSNGDITISDLRPRNVLKDSDGDLYVVDAEFKAENNSRFRFIGEEGATNLDRSEEATTRLDNLNVAREMENAFEEKNARIKKLRNSEPVEITGNEITPSEDLKQYKKNALEYGKKLQGEYTNKDTGRTIQLQRGRKNGGIKEVLSHDTLNDTAQIKSIAAIPSIIENAIYIDSSENQDTHKNPNVVSYHYYICGLKIGGEDYTVRMVEAEEKDGSRYYDHRLTHIEKGKLINELALINSSSSTELSSTPDAEAEDRNRPTNRGEIQTAPISNIKDTRLISLLQTNDQENARKIKLATGWERGADGKWQYDTEAKLQIPKEEKINEIKRLSDILNTEVEIYDTQADLPTNIREKANGEISGYYMPGNDKVAIVLDANTSIGDIQATMLHEIVGHKGIRGLFGNRTDEFLDKVFESMDANVRAEYMERFNSERLAAEEYLSELAEYNPETSGIKKIIAIIRDFFREILGIDLKLSDNDIVYILSKSRERLQNSRNLSENKPLNESYSPNEESNLTETNRIFNDRLSELTEQNSDNIVLDLGNPSEILLSAGIEDKPMKLYGNKVIKKMKKHGFKLEELRNLPEAVATPIAVFNNYQKDGNRSILTELRTEQGNFLVTLDLGKDADVDFNIVTSVFGKGDNNIIDWINKGYATYIDKKKALGYLHFSERNIPEASNSREMKKGQELLSHQSAPIAATAASSDLVSATNIVKEFENPTIPDKNEAVEKRIQQETEETLYRLKSPVKVDVSGDSAIEAAEKISGAQYLQRVIDKDIYRNISYNTLNRNAIQAVGYGRKKLRYFDKRKMENAYKGLFDNMNDLHNLQKTIIDTYGSIDDSLNAYYAENASSSRAQDRTNRFQVEYEQPLINTLAKIRKKFNNDDFMMKYYPSVRTIIERQRVVRERKIKEAQNDPKIKDDRQALFAAIQLAEKKDYAGQTGTYKEILAHEYPEFKFPANFETMTYDEVKDFAKENNLISIEDFVERSENILGNDLVNEFWNNIRKISQYKLYNDYQTGMMSRDMFEKLTYGVTMKELAKKRLDAGEIKQEQYELVLNTFNRPEALLSRGIITENQYNSLKPRYEYYLPLKGTSEIEADEINEYNNKKVKNISALKAVEGHENVARDPLPQLLQDVYGSIMSQEQNRWRNTLLNMLRKYPMPDLYHIQTEYFTPIRNEKGYIIEYVPYVKKVNDKLVFVPTDEELKAKTAIRKRRGLDLDIEINKRQSSEHAVTFLENGDYVTVYFTDPRIAQSINNLNVNTLPTFLDSIMKWGGKINRFRSQFMTTANPEFVIANVIKDFQEANSNILIKEGLKYWKEFNKIYFNPELGAAIRRRLNGKKGDTEIDKYVDEFFKYGGETAYNMLPGYEQKRKDLYKEIKKVNKEGNKAILVGSKIKDWAKDNLEMLNKQAELRARIATYVTSRKHTKREISRSIWDAKEITVNFDKRGSWAKGFGFWQLFWNAGRQSNRMQIQMIKTHPIKWAIAKSVNTAIGFAETVLPWLILDDDDRKNYLDKYFSITPYLRYSNLIMGFGGELVTIPLPPAFIPSHTLGVCMAEMVLRNNEPGFDPTALVIDVANAGANEWLPEFIVDPVFDIANRKDFVISSIVPAQLKPFAEIYDNRNFFGSTIYNDNINEFKPAYQRIYNGTGPTYVNISQTLNNWTGGNEVDRGFIQLNPAILEHLVEGYVSGLGKFGEKAFTTLSGNAESSKDIPVLGRFWRGDIEYYLDRDEKNTYYRLLKQAEEYRYRRNEYRKLNGYESEKEELNKEGELYEPILIQIRKLNRYKRLEKNTSDPKKKEKYKNKQNEVYKKVQQIEEEYNSKKFNQ